MPAIRPGPSEEGPLAQLDQRVAGDARARRPGRRWRRRGPPRSVTTDSTLTTPTRIEAGLDDAGGDEADRCRPADPPGHRVERDGGADAGQGRDDLEPAAPAAPAALLPRPMMNPSGSSTMLREQLQLRDRSGEGEQVQQPAGEGDLAHRVHRVAAGRARVGGERARVWCRLIVVMSCSFWSVRSGVGSGRGAARSVDRRTERSADRGRRACAAARAGRTGRRPGRSDHGGAVVVPGERQAVEGGGPAVLPGGRVTRISVSLRFDEPRLRPVGKSAIVSPPWCCPVRLAAVAVVDRAEARWASMW